MTNAFENLIHSGADKLDYWFSSDVHKIAITGLSRSGKSMLFTSLMTLLQYRASEGRFDTLPLLKSLPLELVERVEVHPVKHENAFPLNEHLASLEKQQWPKATDEVYGFELVIWVKQTQFIKKHFKSHNKVIFHFYDYPGEWLTDLPMLNKDFIQWSDSAWAQQSTVPQKYYAQAWHAYVDGFDFDIEPTTGAVNKLVDHYRQYLVSAKAGGISLLQPGSLILKSTKFDWSKSGFAPLPTKISSDSLHPWTVLFKANYEAFQQRWLKPLRDTYFKDNEKQIILIDLFEGLSHSKQHLLQLKETMSNLSENFVYGSNNWFKQKLLGTSQISKVAFVATKVDMIPFEQQVNLMSLLQEISAGARAKFQENEVDFNHFLVSAIQTTDPGAKENTLRYTNLQNDYVEAAFEDVPKHLKSMESSENFPVLPVKVPKDYLPRILDAQGLDRLFEYLIGKPK